MKKLLKVFFFFYIKLKVKLTCEPFAKGVSITINDRMPFFGFKLFLKFFIIFNQDIH
jgi:hypothetical protein